MDWNWDWDRDRDNDKDKGRDRDNRIYALYSTFFYFAIHFLFRPPRPIYWYPSTTETQLRGILSDVVHFGEPFKYSFIAKPIIFIWVKAPNGRFSPRISGKLRISGFVICSTEKVAAFSLSARAQDNRTLQSTDLAIEFEFIQLQSKDLDRIRLQSMDLANSMDLAGDKEGTKDGCLLRNGRVQRRTLHYAKRSGH